jgi:hypothetical protein
MRVGTDESSVATSPSPHSRDDDASEDRCDHSGTNATQNHAQTVDRTVYGPTPARCCHRASTHLLRRVVSCRVCAIEGQERSMADCARITDR